MDDERKDLPVDEPVDLERSRLLLVWLQARRAVDHCLSDLLAAGPAGERRVRERLSHVDDLETRARQAFVNYRKAATPSAASAAAGSNGTVSNGTALASPARDWSGGPPATPPRLDLVPSEPADDKIDLIEIGRAATREAHGHR